MKVSQPIRSSQASRIQPPFQTTTHPILLSTSHPQQYPLQYSNFVPQQIYPNATMQPRFIDAGSAYRPFPQQMAYPQYPQVIFPPGQQYLPPQYLVQPAPVVRRQPQSQLNPNFDYEQANLLCEAKIIESTVFCVVCGTQYKTSQKEQHIQKHIRKGQERGFNQEALHKLEEYHKKETKQSYLVKPIVEPEEVDMQFDPNIYQVIQEIIYQDESILSKKEAGIGQDANNSFSIFDNNVSISHNNNPVAPPAFDSQPNPFFSRHQKPHEYDIPQFEIPQPSQPLADNIIDPNDHPIVYQEEPIIFKPAENQHGSADIVPIANTLNVYPADVAHLIEEPSNPPANIAENRHSQARVAQTVGGYAHPPPAQADNRVSQSVINQKTSLLANQNQPEYRSVRYESHQFRGFPEETVPKIQQIDPIDRQESFSGPYQIRAPNQQSKKSTEVNISQFIRDLNAQNEGLVVQDRKRIPNQSQW